MQQRAKDLRGNLTDAEKLLWRHLRSRRLEGDKFRRQQILGPYIVDFVCLEKKLIVELDGGQHAESVAYDHRRTVFLEATGFRVMRFWNNEVLGNLESVLSCIRAECAVAPSPQPSPSEGRGGLNATRAITATHSIPHKQVPSPLAGEG